MELTNLPELDTFLATPARRFLFKHSTACPISAAAFEQFQAYTRANPSVPFAWVKVIESRPISNAIEQRTGIRHESPQVFLLEGDKVVWNTSHRAITVEALGKAWG